MQRSVIATGPSRASTKRTLQRLLALTKAGRCCFIDAMPSRGVSPFRLLSLLASAGGIIVLAGCGNSTLGSKSSCKDFLYASQEDQDRAVSRLAVDLRAPDAVTPLGRPNVNYFCADNPQKRLGEAVGRMSHRSTQPTETTTQPSELSDLFKTDADGTAMSASEARKRIASNPNDLKAYGDLATALETEGKLRGAIAALRHYTQLVPENTDALIALSGLYARQGNQLRTKAQIAQAQAQEASANAVFGGNLLSPKTKQQVIPMPTINETISSQANTRFQTLFGKMQGAFTSAEGVYKRLARRTSDPQIVLTLAGFAQQAGDTQAAISAYKRFIKLAPNDPTVPLVKQQLKALRPPPKRGG